MVRSTSASSAGESSPLVIGRPNLRRILHTDSEQIKNAKEANIVVITHAETDHNGIGDCHGCGCAYLSAALAASFSSSKELLLSDMRRSSSSGRPARSAVVGLIWA